MRNLYLIITTIFLSFIAIENSSGAHAPVQNRIRLPSLVIGPPNDTELDDLLSNPGQWKQVRSKTSVILHTDHAFNALGDDKLRRWFSAMTKQELRIELEVGAIKEWSPNSTKTFEIEKVQWDRIIRLGGHIVSLVMDEPLVSSRASFRKPDTYAVEETARFIALVRSNYPDLQIGDVEAYPYISVVDHINWIESLNAGLDRLNTRRLDFYRIDPDWNAFPSLGNWEGVKAIVEACRQRKLPTSLIFWAAKSAGPHSDKSGVPPWNDGVQTQARAVKSAGIEVEQSVLESWIGLPVMALPESDPATFAGSVLNFVAYLEVGNAN